MRTDPRAACANEKETLMWAEAWFASLADEFGGAFAARGKEHKK